jgi:hypothetical protein
VTILSSNRRLVRSERMKMAAPSLPPHENKNEIKLLY